MKAKWNDTVLAESSDTVLVEGNHYFPADSLNDEYFESSEHQSFCPWKGVANYYTVAVNGERNLNAAWFYPEPKEKAKNIENRVAFWNGVSVSES